MKIDKYIDKNILNCTGKIIVITGANSGIGYESTKVLASKGAHIIMACRNKRKANDARNKILALYPNSLIDIFEYDQSSFESINHFVLHLKDEFTHIDALVLNAGIFHPKSGLKTNDGFPLTIGTNYIGAFYLLEQLKDFLSTTKIIFIGSIAAYFKKIKNFDFLKEESTTTFFQYAYSKLAITLLFSYYCENTNFNVYLMHPGISSTNIFSSDGVSYMKWFKKLARNILRFLVHNPKKAALGISMLVANDYENHTALGPRGIWQISGYPKKIKIKKQGKQNNRLLYEKTVEILIGDKQNAKCK